MESFIHCLSMNGVEFITYKNLSSKTCGMLNGKSNYYILLSGTRKFPIFSSIPHLHYGFLSSSIRFHIDQVNR